MGPTFYGVGTGPGDPQLLTLRALAILQKVDVIAAPRTKGKNTLALDIVAQAMDVSDKEILYLDFPMKRNEEERRAAQEENLHLILRSLRREKSVAMLTLGDASMFSNISYFVDSIHSEGFKVDLVPGVTSFCAAAARLKTSLTQRDLPLHIIPAGAMDLDAALRLPGSKVLMKPTLPMQKIRDSLKKGGVLSETKLAENVTLPGERLIFSMETFEEETGYFTTLLVPAGKE